MVHNGVVNGAPSWAAGVLLGVLAVLFLAPQAAPFASALDGAPISVAFEFVPADDAYFPGESLDVEFTVVNTVVSSDYVYDSLAYMEKVMNISAHFSWMAADEYVWNNVSGTSEWLEPDGVGAGVYSLGIDIPATVSAQTYSYYFELEYLAHTAWGNITYYWGVGTTYHDLVVTEETSTAPGYVALFVPESFTPGDEVRVDVNFTCPVPSGADVDDCFPVKALWVEPHFSWMSSGDIVRTNVSSEAEWVCPEGTTYQVFSVTVQAPDDLEPGVYTFFIRVGYAEETPWGEVEATMEGPAETLTVASGGVVDPPGSDGLALAVALVALGAVAVTGLALYRMSKGSTGPTPATGSGYPLIQPMPGQVVHVEPSTIYLVKEDRPRIAFGMFGEAIAGGAAGMLVTREHPDRLGELYTFKAETVLWLTRRAGKDHIDPTELSLLSLLIGKFVEARGKSVVLVEGVEYLITQNDFETVLRFVNHMHEFVSVHDCSVIFVVDPRVLSTRELALLERSARIVEPRVEVPAEETRTAAAPDRPPEGAS